MWQYSGSSLLNSGLSAFLVGSLIASFVLWSLIWKGLALWRAGRNNDKWWFIALLIVNTAGILEILYLFVFGKRVEGKK